MGQLAPRRGQRRPTIEPSPRLVLIGGGPADTVRSEAWNSALVQRLESIVDRATYREIGARTVTHPESVRRYFTYGNPSVAFIAAFCLAYGVSADWLLNGVCAPARPVPEPVRPRSEARSKPQSR